MMNGLDIYEYSGEGYDPTMHFESWRVAFLNSGERFKEESFTFMERHSLTDEVFVLLEGSAVLVIGKEQNKVQMEKGKLYNVLKDCWHHVFLEDNSRILIIENHNTGKENTEYWYLD